MTDEAAFLTAIIANPACDTARLVFADWLQENGQEDRAEFIRIQMEMARCGRLIDPAPAWCDPKWARGEMTRMSVAGGIVTREQVVFESPFPVAEEVGEEVLVSFPGLTKRRLRIESITGEPTPRNPYESVQCGGPVPEPAGGDRPRAWWREQEKRTRELLDLHELDWYGPSLAVIVADAVADAVLTGDPPRAPVFRRGFVEQVTCTAADFLQYADEIVRAHPVTKVAWAPHGRLTWGTYQNRDGTTTTVHTSAEFKAWAEAYWPGVTFELPRGFFHNTGTYSEADWTHGALPADPESTISPPGNP